MKIEKCLPYVKQRHEISAANCNSKVSSENQNLENNERFKDSSENQNLENNDMNF